MKTSRAISLFRPFLVIGLVLGLYSQVGYAITPDEVYERASTAYTRGDFVKAAEHLFAFLQFDPVYDVRKQIEAALKYSEDQLTPNASKSAAIERPPLPSKSTALRFAGRDKPVAVATDIKGQTASLIQAMKEENDSLRKSLQSCRQQASNAGQ